MLNIPEYKEYGGETKIALMDNSSLAFMHELSQRSYPSDGILSVYDLILIPKWVMEEIEDSTYRSTYVEQLQAKGYSEWNGILQAQYSVLFSFLLAVLKIGFVHFIHDAVHILRGQLSAGKKLSKLECEMLGFYFTLFSVGCCSAFNK